MQNRNDEYSLLKTSCQKSIDNKNEICKIINSKEALDNQYYLLGSYYFSLASDDAANCPKAKYWLEQSINENPNKGSYHNSLGLLHLVVCQEYYSPKTAEQYFLTAFEKKDNTEAAANLGNFYRSNQDFRQALYWFEKAIDENPYRAYIGIAGIYTDQNNYLKAKEYLLKAAELNHPEALYNLGVMYYDGDGVEINKKIAKQYFLKALAQGNQRANIYLPKLADVVVDEDIHLELPPTDQ